MNSLTAIFTVECEYFADKQTLKQVAWLNQAGKREAPGDFPAQLDFNPDGQLVAASWYKAGWLHRDHDKPAMILCYDSGKTHMAVWFKEGHEHRLRGLPSTIAFRPITQTVESVSFSIEGQEYAPPGLAPYVRIDSSGSLRDENGRLLNGTRLPFTDATLQAPTVSPYDIFTP